MKVKRKRLILLFILVLAILYVAIYIIPKITGAFNKSVVVEHKPFQITHETQVLFVRDELVYLANRNGTPHYFVGEGTVIRKGTQILNISSAHGKVDEEEVKKHAKNEKIYAVSATKPDNYFTKNVGMVSYFIDKASNKIKPSKINQIKEYDLDSLPEEGINVCKSPEASVVENEPLFKVVDHGKWYMLFWVDEGDIGNYKTGENVTVELKKSKVVANIERIQQQGKRCKIILKCDRNFPGFLALRKAKAKIIIKDYEGLSVPNDSIVIKNGNPGVYVKTKTGEFKFKRVMIITSNGENTLIKDGVFYTKDKGERIDTVKVYDEILKNP